VTDVTTFALAPLEVTAITKDSGVLANEFRSNWYLNNESPKLIPEADWLVELK
jgi:hypothetical protein